MSYIHENLPVGCVICCWYVQKQIHDVDFDTKMHARSPCRVKVSKNVLRTA